MSGRPPDRQSDQRPSGGPAPPPRRRAGPFADAPGCLISLLRLGLLGITFFGFLNAGSGLAHGASLSRRFDAPLGPTYVALIMVAASVTLMLALSVDTAFLLGRLFSRRTTGYLLVAVAVLGAAGLVVGYLGSGRLGAYVTGAYLLLPAASFALTMALARTLFLRFPPPPTRSRRSMMKRR